MDEPMQLHLRSQTHSAVTLRTVLLRLFWRATTKRRSGSAVSAQICFLLPRRSWLINNFILANPTQWLLKPLTSPGLRHWNSLPLQLAKDSKGSAPKRLLGRPVASGQRHSNSDQESAHRFQYGPRRQCQYCLEASSDRPGAQRVVAVRRGLGLQVRRGSVSIFDLFSAAWCVWTPQSRGTQPRLRCSVVGLLRAPPAPRLRFCRGSASCAFPALSPTRFGLLVATKPHTSGGLAALRVPVGEGDSRDISGVR